MTHNVKFGIDTFGDVTNDTAGNPLHHAQVIRNVVEQGVLADQVGIDAIGIGEHHRPDFAVSAPDMILSAIAARTENITLGTAVTVLSSDDPIRVVQRFSTLDAISNGRAEVTLGRGSFTESFDLFGYSLEDYETLFNEKLDLYVAARSKKPITWEGSHRAGLNAKMIYPPTEGRPLPTWIAVGGTPQSVVRAAHYELPVMFAIIGGDPLWFGQLRELYTRALDQFEKPALPVGAHMPGYIADTDEQAVEEAWPIIGPYFGQIAAERGGQPMTKAGFMAQVSREGAYLIGSPETVAKKITRAVKGLGLERFDFKYANGAVSHEKLMNNIELYGTKVIPMVKDMLADS